MKKILSLFILAGLYILLSSHEFWLQPRKFIYRKGDTANIRFNVGENFEGENWSGNRSKTNFLSLCMKEEKTDLSMLLSDKKGDSLQVPLPKDGTAVIVYSGTNTFIELEAAKFNPYLEEDGLKDAIEYRKLHHETDSMGREFYQRSVKTILQVGNKYDTTYKQPTALPLDIIPLSHPYRIKDNEKIAVLILFNKKPLAKQLIKIWHRENDKTIKEEITTTENGLISFPVKTSGKWMVSTVKMIRLENDPKANWQSYWGSVTWGYEK
jgi:hypothetical protein